VLLDVDPPRALGEDLRAEAGGAPGCHGANVAIGTTPRRHVRDAVRPSASSTFFGAVFSRSFMNT
jgi:hypothetical protein